MPPYSFALPAMPSCMLIQKTTFCAVTGWPLLQLYFFSLIVTWRPEYIGGSARLRLLFRYGWVPWPNQYSGRYIRYWKSSVFETSM